MKNKHSKNDLSILDVNRLRQIEKFFLTMCNYFGYNEIKTSTIEHQYIFTAKNVFSTENIERMIDFFDKAEGWGGEPVVLRPDSSPCVIRSYNQSIRNNSESVKQKFCYVENQFMLTDNKEAISERWQCGVENIGLQNPASDKEVLSSDIEVIYMANDIIQAIMPGKTCLVLSYPSIIRSMIENIAPEIEDDLKKEINNKNFNQIKLIDNVKDREKLLNLLSLQGESVEYLITLKDTLYEYTEVFPKFENFINICKLLDNLEYSYLIDFSLLGDLDYYTGIRFQINLTNSGSKKDILCAGGRYDNLIGNMYENMFDEKLSSVSIPATGFALYIKNILNSLPEKSIRNQNVKIYIKNISKTNIKTAQKLCAKLSQLGFAPQITCCPVEDELEDIAMVLEVDKHDYSIKYSQNNKDIFVKMIGGFND